MCEMLKKADDFLNSRGDFDTWVCESTDCKHNLWSEEVTKARTRDANGNRSIQWAKQITPKAIECHGCACMIDSRWTLEEIGDLWHLSRERVRQIEEVARKKLKKRDYPELKLHQIEGVKEESHLLAKMNGKWRQLDVIQTARYY